MLLTQDGEHVLSYKVISHAKGDTGNEIGFNNSNPIFDTCVYKVIFTNILLQGYAAKVIS